VGEKVAPNASSAYKNVVTWYPPNSFFCVLVELGLRAA